MAALAVARRDSWDLRKGMASLAAHCRSRERRRLSQYRIAEVQQQSARRWRLMAEARCLRQWTRRVERKLRLRARLHEAGLHFLMGAQLRGMRRWSLMGAGRARAACLLRVALLAMGTQLAAWRAWRTFASERNLVTAAAHRATLPLQQARLRTVLAAWKRSLHEAALHRQALAVLRRLRWEATLALGTWRAAVRASTNAHQRLGLADDYWVAVSTGHALARWREAADEGGSLARAAWRMLTRREAGAFCLWATASAAQRADQRRLGVASAQLMGLAAARALRSWRAWLEERVMLLAAAQNLRASRAGAALREWVTNAARLSAARSRATAARGHWGAASPRRALGTWRAHATLAAHERRVLYRLSGLRLTACVRTWARAAERIGPLSESTHRARAQVDARSVGRAMLEWRATAVSLAIQRSSFLRLCLPHTAAALRHWRMRSGIAAARSSAARASMGRACARWVALSVARAVRCWCSACSDGAATRLALQHLRMRHVGQAVREWSAVAARAAAAGLRLRRGRSHWLQLSQRSTLLAWRATADRAAELWARSTLQLGKARTALRLWVAHRASAVAAERSGLRACRLMQLRSVGRAIRLWRVVCGSLATQQHVLWRLRSWCAEQAFHRWDAATAQAMAAQMRIGTALLYWNELSCHKGIVAWKALWSQRRRQRWQLWRAWNTAQSFALQTWVSAVRHTTVEKQLLCHARSNWVAVFVGRALARWREVAEERRWMLSRLGVASAQLMGLAAARALRSWRAWLEERVMLLAAAQNLRASRAGAALREWVTNAARLSAARSRATAARGHWAARAALTVANLGAAPAATAAAAPPTAATAVAATTAVANTAATATAVFNTAGATTALSTHLASVVAIARALSIWRARAAHRQRAVGLFFSRNAGNSLIAVALVLALLSLIIELVYQLGGEILPYTQYLL